MREPVGMQRNQRRAGDIEDAERHPQHPQREEMRPRFGGSPFDRTERIDHATE
jgi:hypothetical protein